MISHLFAWGVLQFVTSQCDCYQMSLFLFAVLGAAVARTESCRTLSKAQTVLFSVPCGCECMQMYIFIDIDIDKYMEYRHIQYVYLYVQPQSFD